MRWLLLVLVACHTGVQAASLLSDGDAIAMRTRAASAAQSDPASTQILMLGLDGVSRDILYGLLRDGRMPNLAALIGDHADLEDRLITNLPSTTIPAWTAEFTGEPAAINGVPNNEYFIRETKQFAAPAPVSFVDSSATLEVYTKGAVNDLILVPTIYEKIHATDPAALEWVMLSHVFRGVDTMLVAERKGFVKMFAALVANGATEERKVTSRKPYEALDLGAIDGLLAHLEAGPVPDVLTMYVAGTDLYAHVAKEGPDEARRAYLSEVIDPALGKVVAKLRARGALENRWVIVTADHGHTPIIADETHSLAKRAPTWLAGWKVRPFEASVAAADPYNAVLAYGGAFGFVYLADRSRCTGAASCAWDAPPRYREDVLAVAEATYRDPALDMVFVRKPKPVLEIDRPFEVYIGEGKTTPIDVYLAAHPHPTYVDLARRLDELAVGPHGERAGDVLLLAHFGDRENPEDRFYFAEPFRSWHGSPSRTDSEIPLIVANPHVGAAAIHAWVGAKLGDRPYQRKIADIVLGLRASPPRFAP